MGELKGVGVLNTLPREAFFKEIKCNFVCFLSFSCEFMQKVNTVSFISLVFGKIPLFSLFLLTGKIELYKIAFNWEHLEN